jgi:predicted NAD-dependent protein-ADP-ribosyltransferase YbiA (DUF1768 family)
MDISSGNGYPSSALSNFAPHKFVFDGVEVASMEGLLQAFKFDKEHIQVEVCKMVGRAAKARGRDRNQAWQRVQKLWWKGVAYDRKGDDYQQLLDRAYIAMFEQNQGFAKALMSTGNATLTHSIGRSKEAETILTEREFCRRLTNLRNSTKNVMEFDSL